MRALLFTIFLLQGCVTAYGPKGFTGGYTDQKLGEGRYAVTFEGNGFTPYSTVYQYAMQRARQLCLQDDYDSADVVSVNGDTVSDQVGGNNYNCQTTGSDGSYNTNCSQSAPMTFRKSHVSLVVECEDDEDEPEPEKAVSAKLVSNSQPAETKTTEVEPSVTIVLSDGRKSRYTNLLPYEKSQQEFLVNGYKCIFYSRTQEQMILATLTCFGKEAIRVTHICRTGNQDLMSQAYNMHTSMIEIGMDSDKRAFAAAAYIDCGR